MLLCTYVCCIAVRNARSATGEPSTATRTVLLAALAYQWSYSVRLAIVHLEKRIKLAEGQ